MGWRGVGARLSRSLHRAVRHAVVHLPAADLLRRHEADARRAVAGDLARRRRARDRADRHRLDGDRRVRQPLRLFLHRLPPRAAHLRARRRRAGAAGARRCSGSLLWALINGALVFARLCRPAVRLARARLRRRRRGGRGRGAAGQERPVPAAALLRRATRSSSISPSSCRWRRPASCCSRPASSPTSARSRCSSRSPASIGALAWYWAVRGTPLRFLFERPALGRGSSPSARRRRCSRRNDSQHAPVRALIQARRRPTFGPCQHPPNRQRRKARRSRACRQPAPSAEGRRPRLPGRRLGLHLPRLSRAAAAHPQVGRAADQRRARLLQHAVEAAAAT